MSGIHSLRPILRVKHAILVTFALLVLFPTERVGHTSLSQFQRGSDTVRMQLGCQVGEVEVQVCVMFFVLFFLTYVDDVLLILRYSMVFWFKWVGRYVVRLHRDYG